MKAPIESFVLGSESSEGGTLRDCRDSAARVLQIAVVIGEDKDYVFISTSPDPRQWNQSHFKISKRTIQERSIICEAESTDRNISVESLMCASENRCCNVAMHQAKKNA